MDHSRWAPLAPLVFLLGCSGGGSDPSAALDAPPVIDDAVRAQLAALGLAQDSHAPPDQSNRLADDASAAAFGQRMFFEPAMSGRLMDGDNDGSPHTLGKQGDTGKVACAGCHAPSTAFSDARSFGQQISLAAGWGKRRAPSLLDVGQSKLLMWDGRRDALYNQIFGVIESPVEMNSSRLFAAEQIFALHRSEYEALFGPLPPLDDATRFPALSPETTGCSMLDEAARACSGEEHGIPGDAAEFDGMAPADQQAVSQVIVNVGKAIGAYERLLTCGPSRFDAWLDGDATALTPSEQRGAVLFVGKGNCASCHSGPFLSDEHFHNVGLKPGVVATVFLDADDRGAALGLLAMQADPLNVTSAFSDGDDGRDAQTIDATSEGAFRTPKLRCAAQRPSFMHTAQFADLSTLVAFFARGGDPYGYPGTNELGALELSLAERADLVAFLEALNGPGPDSSLRTPP